jgi:putative colanic acid biosynthesis acetyltransferase WcaF
MSSAIRNNLESPPATAAVGADAYLVPAFSFSNRALRALWGFIYVVFFRTSPRPFHAWRVFLLRCFGAKLGKNCHIYSRVRIWAPWNLKCDELATIADDAIVYNPALVTLGSHAIVSQQAYLCGATHDYEDPKFPLIALPITIGAHAWICARATVQPGLSVGDGAVLALGAVATKNLEPWTVYGGVPARKIRMRIKRADTPKEEVTR